MGANLSPRERELFGAITENYQHGLRARVTAHRLAVREWRQGRERWPGSARWAIVVTGIAGLASTMLALTLPKSNEDTERKRATIEAAKTILIDPKKMAALGICKRDIDAVAERYEHPRSRTVDALSPQIYEDAGALAYMEEISCLPQAELGKIVIPVNNRDVVMTKEKALLPTFNY